MPEKVKKEAIIICTCKAVALFQRKTHRNERKCISYLSRYLQNQDRAIFRIWYDATLIKTYIYVYVYVYVHTSFYQITTDTKVSKFLAGKHFIRMTEQRVRAKYVYVFENDCAFVITAMGAFFYCSTVSVNRKYVSNVEKKKTESGETKCEIRIPKLSPCILTLLSEYRYIPWIKAVPGDR